MSENKKFDSSLIMEALDTIKGLQKDIFGDFEYQKEGRDKLEYEFIKAEKEKDPHMLLLHAPENESLAMLSIFLKSALEKFDAPKLYLKNMNFSEGIDIKESVHLSESKSTISIDEPALGVLLNLLKLPNGEEQLLKTESRKLDIKYPDLLTGYNSDDFVSAYSDFAMLFKQTIRENDEQKYQLVTGNDIHKDVTNYAAKKHEDFGNKDDRKYGFDTVALLGVDFLIQQAKTKSDNILVEADLSKDTVKIIINNAEVSKIYARVLSALIKDKHLTTELKDIENLKFNHQIDENGHVTINLDEHLSKFLTKYSLPNTEGLAKKHGIEQLSIKDITQRDTGEGNGNLSTEESLEALRQLRSQNTNGSNPNTKEPSWVSKTNKNKNFLDRILSYFANPISLDEILKDSKNGSNIAKEIIAKGTSGGHVDKATKSPGNPLERY